MTELIFDCKVVRLPCEFTYFYKLPEELKEWLDGDCLEDNCIDHDIDSNGIYSATIEINTCKPSYPDYEGDFDIKIKDVVKIYE